MYRESVLLDTADVGVSRLAVKRLLHHEHSIDFGSDTTTTFGFSLPAEFPWTSVCGNNGYSRIKVVRLSELLTIPVQTDDEVSACVRRKISASGTTYLSVVLSDKVFVKVL
jgi:hypothetical protein